MNRNDITEKIITVKVAKGIQWAEVASISSLSRIGPVLKSSP